MIDSYWVVRDSDQDIVHYGVKGMKWGVRRYQNDQLFEGIEKSIRIPR